jgi:hypothetical protein
MLDVDSRSQPYEVSTLGAAGVLDYLRDAEARSRQVDRSKLRLALQYCLVHQVADVEQAATWGEFDRASADCDTLVGGEGTPMIRAGVAEAFGAALGVSTGSGLTWLNDALGICFRLPLLHAQVEELVLPTWKARKVAQFTEQLGLEACAFVDAELAGRARGFGLTTIENVVALAIAKFHPDLLAETEKAAKDLWDVSLEHATVREFTGTSSIEATGDTLGLTRFYEMVCTVATALGKLGDTDTFNQRKAKAFGIIADQDQLIDILTRADNLQDPPEPANTTASASDPAPTSTGHGDGTGADPGSGEPAAKPAGKRRRPRRSAALLLRKPAKVKLHLHLNASDLIALSAETGEHHVIGEVEKLGPATLAKIREWLATSGATITPIIDPVIDLNRTEARDAHDPPEWMRQLVILRDPHCVFPWCERNAKTCDLDHIEPYDTGPDDTGPDDRRAPPGQTRPENLAPLCRRHHRAKTLYGWTYRRLPDGTYRWKDPHGHTYIVTTETGTTDLG